VVRSEEEWLALFQTRTTAIEDISGHVPGAGPVGSPSNNMIGASRPWTDEEAIKDSPNTIPDPFSHSIFRLAMKLE